jgi:hypothetical protein
MSIYKECAATQMRDEALDRVYSRAPDDWKAGSAKVVRSMKGQKVTGEDIRLACEARDLRPHHHNAWGAFISWLKRQRVIVGTGTYVNMKGPRSNARKTEVYQVL